MARNVTTGFLCCGFLFSTALMANAATVIKLNLAGGGSDVSLTAGQFGTADDGIVGTTGNQNTDVEYTGPLEPLFTDINNATASFSMSGLQTTGFPSILGGTLIIQDFIGGTINLYSPTNTLLLSGNLMESTLTGVIGNEGTGALFTTTVGQFTGGSILPDLQPNSLNLSMTLTNVNGGLGFLVIGNTLQPFTADSTVSISGTGAFIPEPASAALLMLGAVIYFARRGQRS
jgi:hypothetical protein